MEEIKNNEKDTKETVYWAITIFCKKDREKVQYLVVKNTETWNISFVSGGKEYKDKNLLDTARREIKEELNIDPKEYTLIPTSIKHEFVFWEKKKERAGKNGSYQVFWADGSKLGAIHHTEQLSKTTRMTKEDVLETLTFEDVKEVFERATWEITL